MSIFYQLSFSLFLLITAPQKSEEIITSPVCTASSNNIYITDWENSSSWEETIESSGKLYTSKRQIPQLTNEILNKGLVLVYNKGYNFNDAALSDKPISIPFYFFPSGESIKDACKWFITKTKGEIELGLSLPEAVIPAFKQKQNDIQFRYLIIEEGFLKTHKLTKAALQNMTYMQVIKLANATP